MLTPLPTTSRWRVPSIVSANTTPHIKASMRKVIPTAGESPFSRMGATTQAILWRAMQTGEEFTFTLTDQFTKEISSIPDLVAMAHLLTSIKEWNMKANSRMACPMEQAEKPILMEGIMRENSTRVRSMGKDYINGPMDPSTKAVSNMAWCTEKEF